MSLTFYLARRILQMIPVLFGVSLVTFALVHSIPGDPARVLLGQNVSPEGIAFLRRQWGLDQPLPVQYILFLQNMVDGNMGTSITYQVPVSELILQRLPVTWSLVAMVAVMTIAISVPLATLAALHKDGLLDHLIRTFMMLGFGMPSFWLGLLLLLIFAVHLGWFPVAGIGDNPLANIQYLALPSLTISLSLSVVIIRPLRSQILLTLESDYIFVARAKGVPLRRLITHHILRNALLPAFTILGLQMGWLLSGTVVVETVFSLPGVGLLLIHSVLARDYPTVQALAIVFAVSVMVVTLLTDVTYRWFDPRIGR